MIFYLVFNIYFYLMLAIKWQKLLIFLLLCGIIKILTFFEGGGHELNWKRDLKRSCKVFDSESFVLWDQAQGPSKVAEVLFASKEAGRQFYCHQHLGGVDMNDYICYVIKSHPLLFYRGKGCLYKLFTLTKHEKFAKI